ncbi:MAG: hypothetical protein KGN38_01085 [Actinomycetales bacterium]|nr:hypothetical protein [Actinomycetales bacterium]
MSFTKKIIGVAASAALVAGVGAFAVTPANAAGAKPTGATVINVPMALLQGATAAGVQITPIAPSSADATMDSVGVTFPVTGPLMDGVLHHSGGLSIASARVTLTWSDPTIEYATDGGDTAVIKGTIEGVPAGSGFEALNGQRAGIFDVKNMVITNKKGKIEKQGKGFKRTYTQTITGDVTVVDSAQVVQILNGLIGVPLFTAGMDFGTLDSSWSVTRTCKTKKACA